MIRRTHQPFRRRLITWVKKLMKFLGSIGCERSHSRKIPTLLPPRSIERYAAARQFSMRVVNFVSHGKLLLVSTLVTLVEPLVSLLCSLSSSIVRGLSETCQRKYVKNARHGSLWLSPALLIRPELSTSPCWEHVCGGCLKTGLDCDRRICPFENHKTSYSAITACGLTCTSGLFRPRYTFTILLQTCIIRRALGGTLNTYSS